MTPRGSPCLVREARPAAQGQERSAPSGAPNGFFVTVDRRKHMPVPSPAASARLSVLAPTEPASHLDLLAVDAELGRHVAPADLARLSARVRTPVVEIDRGRFDPEEILAAGTNTFATIVVSGLVGREMCVERQPALQLLGPGDVLGRSVLDAELVPAAHAWSALSRTRLALLDDSFLNAVRHRPRLMTGVVERLLERQEYLLVQLAAAQAPRVEDRLLMLFQVLAGRWGTVRAEGIHIEIGLTHEALGRIIGARRPTVTLALKGLSLAGHVRRQPDGSWVLSRDAPLAEPSCRFLIDEPDRAGPPQDDAPPATVLARAS